MFILINENCRRCAEYASQGSTAQNFEYHCEPGSVVGPTIYWFDVEGARAILTAHSRPQYLIDPHTLPANTCDDLIAEHIAHVPLIEPGIIATVAFEMAGSGLQTFNILIDGRHRAARALNLSKPFFCALLTEEETGRIMTTDINEMMAISLARLLRRETQ